MMKRLQFLDSDGLVHLLLFGLFSIVALSGLYTFNLLNFGYTVKSSEQDVRWLLILFSYPHFIASYFWFYKNKDLREESRFVGVYLPGIIIALLILVFTLQISYLQQGMLMAAWILLFWHFAKQSYGCSVYLAKSALPQLSKTMLLNSYLCLAGFGFLNIHRKDAQILLFKSYVKVFNVPEYFSLALLIFAWLLFAGFIWSYVKESGTKNRLIYIVIPWVANLMWFSWWAIESFFALIPIFHALQYGPFILQGVSRLQLESKKFIQTMFGIFVLSTLFFVGIPYLMLQYWPAAGSMLVSGIFIFLNLHHFFIDSVGWRLSRESLRKILFS